MTGVDSWANFAIALKAYTDYRPTTSSAENTNLDAVYLMLMGYALEDLAKCIIAYKAYNAKITDAVPFEEKLKKLKFIRKDGEERKFGIHDLDDLYYAKDLGFEVSATEINHLKVISSYTEWKGRYPVPLDIAKMPSSTEPSFENLSKTAISIYDRTMAEVERLRSLRS